MNPLQPALRAVAKILYFRLTSTQITGQSY